MRRTRVTRLPAAVAVPALGIALGLGLSGCGASTPTGWHYDAHRAWWLAGDKHASIDDLVQVGTVDDVADTGARRLVTYTVEPQDGELPTQAVWRLYDGAGHTMVDGNLGVVAATEAYAEVHPVEGGFLVENYSRQPLLEVTDDGRVHGVAIGKRPEPTHEGDTFLSARGALAYHPDTHTVAPVPLPSYPRGKGPQGVALDAVGTVWVLDEWDQAGEVPLRWSSDGRHWHRTVLRAPRGTGPADGRIFAAGGEVYWLETRKGGEADTISAVWSHSAGGAGPWTRTPVSGTVHAVSPSVVAVDGSVVVLSALDGPFLLADDGRLRPLHVPDRIGTLRQTGNGVYWIGAAKHTAWHADSLGEHWRQLSR